MIWIVPFCVGVLTEIVAIAQFHYTQINKPFYAATINTLLLGCQLFIFVGVVNNWHETIPFLFGIWIGGYWSMMTKKYLEKKK